MSSDANYTVLRFQQVEQPPQPVTENILKFNLAEQLFYYTSGRWLWGEESQLRERFLAFNVQELQRVAAESVGAQSCVSITKLAEGGYNKVFRLVMDNGSVAIARIQNPNAGPAHKATASEVATIDFVRFLLSLMSRNDIG